MKSPSLRPGRWAVLAALLVACRVPYWWTQHFQEDAFITFRTAFNLADHGEYTFNLGERYPAATSVLYGHLVAGVRWLAGPRALGVLQVGNACLAVIGSWWFASALFADRRKTIGVWVLLALTPITLQLSYSGMETALLVFLLGLLARGLGESESAAALAAGFLLPLARPDALVFPGLAVLLASGWSLRRRASLAAAAVAGAAASSIVGWLYSGFWLPTTALAKLAAYQPDRSLSALFGRCWTVYGRESFFAPFNTKFLSGTGFSELATLVGIAAIAFVFRCRPELRPGAQLGILAAWVLAVPLFFAIGANTFPWYFWPSGWIAAGFVGAAILLGLDAWRPGPRAFGYCLLAASLLALDGARFVLSVNWGAQTVRYLGGIGTYIGQVAKPGDSLLLEPAGAIPFFSGLVTYDEVGLASPRILPYLKRDSVGNWLGFARDVRPTFTVQRDHFFAGSTALGHTLTAEERAWFDKTYELIADFHFDAAKVARSPFEQRILRLSTPVRYYVFRLRDRPRLESAPPPPL